MKIFTYWDAVELPILNKYCMYTWNKYNPDIPIICINDTNVHDYIKKLPDNFNKLIAQHKSDYIRTYMLYNHGGIWLDNTIILKGHIGNVFDLNIKDKLQLFRADYLSHIKTNFLHIYDKFYLENNYMCCLTPNNKLLECILNNFEWCIKNLNPHYNSVLYFKKLYSRGNIKKYNHFIQGSTTCYLTYMNIMSMLITGSDVYNDVYIISENHSNFLVYRDDKFIYDDRFIHLKLGQFTRKNIIDLIKDNKLRDYPELNKWFDSDYFSIT